MKDQKIRIISRKSRLAQWQAQFVKQQLETFFPELSCELITRTTLADRISTNLKDKEGKALFVKELQQSILNKEADVAVHSVKDMSAHDTSDLCIAAFLEREDPRDVFLSKKYAQFKDLPDAAIVGTSSPRREAQALFFKNTLNIKLLRGNVDTRIKRLEVGEYDAIILAAAGLKRLGLLHKINHYFEAHTFIPAIGQGVIGVECLANNNVLKEYLSQLDNYQTRCCVIAERAVNLAIGGDCFTPIGAYAFFVNKKLKLKLIATLGCGYNKMVHADILGDPSSVKQMGLEIGKRLLSLRDVYL